MSRLVGVPRLVAVLSLAAVTLGLAAPAASAVPVKKLDADLAALWTTVLQTPADQNPFGTGGPASGCFNLGGTVAPFGPHGVKSCTVKPGTKIFVAASSFECSTFEGNGTTEAQLRNCARQMDVPVAPSVTVDGKSVPVTEAETRLLHIVLPANNIFGLPAGTTGLSVGHGWIALLHPLTPGTHTIVIHLTGAPDITTTIIVSPRPLAKLTGFDPPAGALPSALSMPRSNCTGHGLRSLAALPGRSAGPLAGENFLSGFKGAQSAPCAVRRVIPGEVARPAAR